MSKLTAFFNTEPNAIDGGQKRKKRTTHNTRGSLVVANPTTSPALPSLCGLGVVYKTRVLLNA